MRNRGIGYIGSMERKGSWRGGGRREKGEIRGNQLKIEKMRTVQKELYCVRVRIKEYEKC